MGTPLVVTSAGMVTGVGMTAPASCAAIRCAIDNFQETRFIDENGEWLMASQVPLARPWRGEMKLLKMAGLAIRECLAGRDELTPVSTPLLLCLPDDDRLDRGIEDDDELLRQVQEEIGLRFHARSHVIARGHVSVAVAVQQARRLLTEPGIRQVIVAATDSLLIATTLTNYEEKQRLLTSGNSDGFIPGEAAAAIALELMQDSAQPQLACHGIGFGIEHAHIDSDEPLRADGLTEAIKGALRDAGWEESVLQFKIIDVSGAQYHFKEAALAFSRIDRTKRTEFDVWHPADCVGEVGAAIGPIMIGVLKAACEKGYAKGDRVLLHVGNDDGKRAALVFAWHAGH
jgi:3-oxoacyl-[acyl-carrier-protein] synthase-1